MKNSSPEADAFADALAPIQLDAVGELLLYAAEVFEGRQQDSTAHHAFNAILAVAPSRSMYLMAAGRLVRACGPDNSDLTKEQIIDSLVAAAYWDV